MIHARTLALGVLALSFAVNAAAGPVVVLEITPGVLDEAGKAVDHGTASRIGLLKMMRALGVETLDDGWVSNAGRVYWIRTPWFEVEQVESGVVLWAKDGARCKARRSTVMDDERNEVVQ